MRRITAFLKRNALSALSLFALMIGTTSVSTNSMFFIHQVKCPKELLK